MLVYNQYVRTTGIREKSKYPETPREGMPRLAIGCEASDTDKANNNNNNSQAV